MSTATPAEPLPADGTGLIRLDPWLAPYADKLRQRHQRYLATRGRILASAGSLAEFACAHQWLGLTRGEKNGEPGVWYREWAPAAIQLNLIGDFNNWDRMSEPLTPVGDGVWEIFLPDRVYAARLTHASRVKVHVFSKIGPRDRIPAFIRRAIPDEHSHDYCGQYWNPPEPYAWRHAAPRPSGNLRIYETHIGMATEEHRVGQFSEFTRDVLPRIVKGGYNAIQIMAILEHPYYGSFGYQVSNFFAVSSRFGTPEELKALIDAAHGAGLVVLLDLVHSHAVKNMNEGLNHFDGTEYQYFHAGGRGQHPAWDSLCFDYGKLEVLRFLLSNVRFWLEEYRFDGFRFDGVTSMLYLDHGLGRPFSLYDDYFPPHVDEDAITYLQLANELAHEINPDCISIAEDVSGMVGTCRPVAEGGLGFDYRLAMGIPDYWIKVLKERKDEQWQMDEIFGVLCNRRAHEKHVAYAESHDQALVGDKTIAMWLMDADIYWHMTKGTPHLVIDRGMALHKMIRLVTFALGGEAWLNFMGNEFGHPEWVDFPREGNGFSYHYARRQWSLADDPLLRYHALNEFDRAMLRLDSEYGLLGRPQGEKIQTHEDNKLLVFSRGPLLFAFNFHPTHSLVDHRIGVPHGGDYKLVLNTDDIWFAGHGEVVPGQRYPHQGTPWDHRLGSIQIYLPARTALVLAPV
ncbi:MAG: alpha amylase C-terminal domain-containing protein [Phycisphaerales bacterium]|nr:alpha amylase C-terminal domain-containing protein [Phycisphaerales bacterium]